jgi:hypothetical protein
MSPEAVTSGAETLSRSHSNRTDASASATVRTRSPIEARTPPAIDTTMKSAREIAPGTAATIEAILASTAMPSENVRVSTNVARTFCPTTVSVRAERRNVPVWMAVPSRLPREPNTCPRMPMAAGTAISRPGSRSSVSLITPRVSPAARLAAVAPSRAPRPCRRLVTSEPTRSRRRATGERGPSRIETGRFRRA